MQHIETALKTILNHLGILLKELLMFLDVHWLFFKSFPWIYFTLATVGRTPNVAPPMSASRQSVNNKLT